MGDIKHDIEKYLRGEMSAAEMHALEKKALDDPFLADALEGAGATSIDEFSADMADLRMKIKERVEPNKKVISLWYWPMRIAAGLLVIAVASYIVITFTSDTSDTKLAYEQPKSEEAVEPLSQSAADTIQPAAEVTTEESADAIVKDEQPIAASRARIASEKPTERIAMIEKSVSSGDAESAPLPAEPLQEVLAVNIDDNKEDEIVVIPQLASGLPSRKMEGLAEKEVISDKRKAAKEEYRYSNRSSAPTMMKKADVIIPNRVVRGKVTDADDGAALPGVNVVVKGSNVGTVTNAEGSYELSLGDSTNKELEFSFVGMQIQDVPVTKSDSVNVKLSADYASLSEVVVVGYASREDGVVRDESNNYEIASPAGGRKEFKTYLVTNLKYPPLAIEHKIEGKVTVQFFVDTNGTLSDFRIIKGIGDGCDQEALRLIRQGPKWTATKRNDVPLRSKVKVKVKFKLPK